VQSWPDSDSGALAPIGRHTHRSGLQLRASMLNRIELNSASGRPTIKRARGGVVPSTLASLRRRRGSARRLFLWASGVYRQDIPADISPQKPHCVAGSAVRLRRCRPRACSSSRNTNRMAAARSTADNMMGNLVFMPQYGLLNFRFPDAGPRGGRRSKNDRRSREDATVKVMESPRG